MRVTFRAFAALAITAALVAILALWRPSEFYPWLKAAHVIAVIAWMAGMLCLPMLFAYHRDTAPGTPESEIFKVMERRLLIVIVNPAIVAGWVLGLWLAWDGGALTERWLHAKFALVVAISAVHGMISRWSRDFAADRRGYSRNFYRSINAILAAMISGIVILVIVKPF